MSLLQQGLDFEGEEYSRGQLVHIARSLAISAHWSPKLDDLAAALMSRGGLAPLSPAQIANALWSFATLNHPADLLSDASVLTNGRLLDAPLH